MVFLLLKLYNLHQSQEIRLRKDHYREKVAF